MSEPFDPFQESVAWVADTGVFIACGRQQNTKYTALERFAQRNDLTFVIPAGLRRTRWCAESNYPGTDANQQCHRRWLGHRR